MIDRLKNARLLVIGDVMLDRFVQGEVARISPEAPVPVFRWSAERQMLGGAGNVIANLRALGAATTIVCRVGDDADGETVRQLLAASGAD
ncbi:MAG: bifunctional heptose 7-phosphate kinase/heptose 1-phosphate adenyltransferase, partial [Kiritimatiellae bacterium]|nr:bifunctional heptose 7-phosphate kinase/heptose 1-phosphate adenyltransferase [Kiritimatiellia bacterium]